MEETTETQTFGCQRINIRTIDGPHELTAVVFGQWAAHATHDNRGWGVTHVPTGMSVSPAHPGVYLSEYQARFIALRLSMTVPILNLGWPESGEYETPESVSVEHVEAIRRAVREATE